MLAGGAPLPGNSVRNAPGIGNASGTVNAPAVVSSEAVPPPSQAAPPADEESHDHMMTIPHGPTIHFWGFFDMNFDVGSVAQQLEYPLPVPAHTSFRAGGFDLFMTSQLSEKLSFLTELVFSTDQANAFGVDLERFR